MMFSRAVSTSSFRRRSSVAIAARSANSIIAAPASAPYSTFLSNNNKNNELYGVRKFSSSSSSHDDFAPKRKTVDGADEAMKLIQEHVNNNPIMLYMKGNPSMPMCKKV
jgi:hypothetical protein